MARTLIKGGWVLSMDDAITLQLPQLLREHLFGDLRDGAVEFAEPT